jgi:hypothetical protein
VAKRGSQASRVARVLIAQCGLCFMSPALSVETGRSIFSHLSAERISKRRPKTKDRMTALGLRQLVAFGRNELTK